MAELRRALASRHHAFVLHYVGATFASANRRVTALAARNMGTGVTECFEVEAELRRAAIDPMEASAKEIDIAERRMLDAFCKFVRNHPNHFWLHWNMRNSVFGFLGIENRHRELGGYPVVIPEACRLDLADRLADIYGDSYAATTNRLRSLAVLNGIPVPHLVDGPLQGDALERREFGVGTRSLLNRLDVMYAVATRTAEERLKTASTFRDRVDAAGGFIKWAKEHPVAVGFAIAAPVVTVVLGGIKLWSIFG